MYLSISMYLSIDVDHEGIAHNSHRKRGQVRGAFFFFFSHLCIFFYLLVKATLIYNILLTSGVQHNDSVFL